MSGRQWLALAALVVFFLLVSTSALSVRAETYAAPPDSDVETMLIPDASPPVGPSTVVPADDHDRDSNDNRDDDQASAAASPTRGKGAAHPANGKGRRGEGQTRNKAEPTAKAGDGDSDRDTGKRRDEAAGAPRHLPARQAGATAGGRQPGRPSKPGREPPVDG